MPEDSALVVGVLSQLLGSSEVTSIEILPGGLNDWETIDLPPDTPRPSSRFPFLFVEGNLGIPQKVLYALYLATASISWRSASVDNAIKASSVIIILNPAHQTALNARKSLITQGHLDPEKELVLLELIARGSPECAKQSVIWDHRRWCLSQIFGLMGACQTTQPLQFWGSSEEMQLYPKIGPTAVQRELALVQHTCETYPRNYHSWTYWHFIIDVCYASVCSTDNSARQQEFLGIIVAECKRLRHWVEQHVSDYSAMHQLSQTHNLLDHLKTRGMLTSDIDGVFTSSILIDHALSLLISYPSHESLWMYLRIALLNETSTNHSVILDKLERQIPPSNLKRQFFKWLSTTIPLPEAYTRPKECNEY
ncbi:Protein prenyltransferase alpha subunit repeat-containing protein 1-B [Psilocybe cubensis]|uniref:Uncharacterized protein n=2 Tax=Psilocybe cubensis TaxID=181762 RepID=A0A8H7Y3F9_PSICU|nr:Protein prenyltransferase alpha subunit repeat-containing protein 1-B [Psilocybe cubensis]KAH9485481.1 Protein prenyltransferase alpha subunit repeat-containing protein 1-B [Psilocybe cubensis]